MIMFVLVAGRRPGPSLPQRCAPTRWPGMLMSVEPCGLHGWLPLESGLGGGYGDRSGGSCGGLVVGLWVVAVGRA